ncbi:MFS transporter, putative [Penicillium digitatum]|uniref:F-box domain-containing protein n=3 Tax=Penicillium digitatum TaxID=36651 RepID=K9G9Q5_PEND2|nr:hypothetical protein PDIP_81700 [Penicillium digitatum Pd1]EKV05730.1 hypothetical protein PDIP_81700 [Penicillium digitatum Pd1]EKV18690.1 hypothetical protein PDIG_07580 [Penicillium digitatum PHI26]KAG0161274.1 hypothetical protein PDIDSM_8808 [Penicillium digitatum]QQK40447.1 MFS transporter, putative [Penicillium digitatum]
MSISKSSRPHDIFLINELLENVLLHTDMRTLLTSAQRVSRVWNTMIRTSVQLQESLFFKPSKFEISDPSQRLRNPLLEDILWAQFFLKQQRTSESKKTEVSRFPLGEPERRKLKNYLRKDASWKRMLLQQPPTASIGVIEIIKKSDSEFTKLSVSPNQFLRMGHLLTLLERGSTLVPTRNKWILWSGRSRVMPLNFECWTPKWVYEPSTLRPVQEWIPENIDWDSLRLEVGSMYLNDFDCGVVIVSERRQMLFQGADRVHRESKLDRRLQKAFGECRVEVGRKHINHSWIPIKGVGADRRWILRPCSATPLVPMLSDASEASDSSSVSSGSLSL